MQELDLQEKYLINFLCEHPDGLQYKEAKANTVSPQFFIVEDLKEFLSETPLNKDNYKKLLRKFETEKALFDKLIPFWMNVSSHLLIWLCFQQQQNSYIRRYFFTSLLSKRKRNI